MHVMVVVPKNSMVQQLYKSLQQKNNDIIEKAY